LVAPDPIQDLVYEVGRIEKKYFFINMHLNLGSSKIHQFWAYKIKINTINHKKNCISFFSRFQTSFHHPNHIYGTLFNGKEHMEGYAQMQSLANTAAMVLKCHDAKSKGCMYPYAMREATMVCFVLATTWTMSFFKGEKLATKY
jgi:hypothetical protein